MSPHADPESAALFPLDGRDVIGVRGPDAADFLHRLLTIDCRRLAPGERALGGLHQQALGVQLVVRARRSRRGVVARAWWRVGR